MSNRSKIISVLLAAIIIVGGIMLRTLSGNHSTLAEDTLTPYYFDKTNRLIAGGFPKEDIWEWAPGPFPENAPPGLAYASAMLFKLRNIFQPRMTLLEFANIFPIVAFSFWCAVFLIFWGWRRKNLDAAIIFLAVLSFTPSAISLTAFANYTQETLGVFLLFLALYTFAQFTEVSLPSEERLRKIFAEVSLPSEVRLRKILRLALPLSVITLLILTWQQFPIFYFVAAPPIIWLIFKRKFKEAAWYSAILIAPLLVSEAIMRLFIRSGYSSLAMVKEFILGFWLGFQKDPDMLTAMVRGNWRHPGIMGIYQLYGPLALALLPAGIFISLRQWRETKHQISMLAAFIGFALIWQFEKEKNLALGLFLFPIAQAIEAIFDIQEARLPKIGLIFEKSNFRKLIAAIILAIFLIGGWYFFNKTPTGIAMITKFYPPKPEIAVEHEKNSDGTIDVNFRMTNRGGTSFFSDKIWFGLSSGMHIEVCNAEILASGASSPTSEYTWHHYAVYSYARWGDCYFVEIKFKQLRHNQWGEAFFKIRPESGSGKNQNPVLYYRGWMPETSCILRYKNAGGETPEEEKLLESEGEPCIIRTPPHNDENFPICPVRVQAARMEIQNFRCLKLNL